MVLLAHEYNLNSVCNAALNAAVRIFLPESHRGMRTEINYIDRLTQYTVSVKMQSTTFSIASAIYLDITQCTLHRLKPCKLFHLFYAEP